MHTDVISFTGREPGGLLLDASGRKPFKYWLLCKYLLSNCVTKCDDDDLGIENTGFWLVQTKEDLDYSV